MKKFSGINRNKMIQFQSAKLNSIKRKNRFKAVNHDQDLQISQLPQSNSLVTSTTQNSVGQQPESIRVLQSYQQAKENIKAAAEFKKKLTQQCKLRITAFKESQAKKHDQNVCNLSKKAIQHLLKAQKTLAVIRNMKSYNQSQQKYYRNMEKSLAQQIRQISKQLRFQQKQHFDRLKSYQKGTQNVAIQLSQSQRQKMKGQFTFQQQSSMQLVEQMQQNNRNNQIIQLVKSINQLSSIYKQLNQLVIQQGSIIDRIDYNIQETFTHVEKANQHLRGAEQKASSPFAQRCMISLLAIIMVLAIILGFKYSK